MNAKTKRVVAGWLKLDEAERQAFEREITRVRNAPSWQQANVREELTNVVTGTATGPNAEGCPCCGR